MDLLISFAGEGQSVLIVTHNREIAKVAHRVIYLRDGKILKIKQNEKPINASELVW